MEEQTKQAPENPMPARSPSWWRFWEATAGGAAWWVVDHPVLDRGAVPTFVDVERASDARARRGVGAQRLDDAATATGSRADAP